jgi:hypothetical protein
LGEPLIYGQLLPAIVFPEISLFFMYSSPALDAINSL